jgi:hypothetical protein
MPNKRFLDFAEQTTAPVELLEKAYGPAKNQDEKKLQAERFVRTQKVLTELMTPSNGRQRNVPKISLKEAVHADDFQILFPRVVQDVLTTPVEPQFIGQNLLARTIQVDTSWIREFPSMGAIRAFELHDTQEPPEQDPSFKKNIGEIRVRRFGLRLEVTQDVIDESQWDILALYTQQAGFAMRRLKEELIFNEYTLRAVNLFDNGGTNLTKFTRGMGSNGTAQNCTFDHEDLLDMMAALAANGYTPTDIILHPLAWSIWAKDPILRFQLLHRGAIGQSLGTFQGTDDDQNANVFIPFSLNPVVTPFQTFSLGANPNAGIATGVTANYTTITVVDRNSSLLVAQKTPMGISEWDNPARNIRNLMFEEKYGLSILNGGRSAVTAKNIRVATNYAPVYTLRNVTAS